MWRAAVPRRDGPAPPRAGAPATAAALALALVLGGPTSLGAAPPAAPGTSDAPVADAAERGDRDRVRELLRGGADVNAAQGDGMTALHWAATHGDAELARMLLYAGAHTGATTRLGGITPLHIAAEHGHAEAARALVEGGADPGARTDAGVTPLHFAAGAGADALVALLLDRGVEVDPREEASGQTPLMFAASNNRASTVTLLVARGADPEAATEVVDYPERARIDGEERSRRRALERARREALEATGSRSVADLAAAQLQSREEAPDSAGAAGDEDEREPAATGATAAAGDSVPPGAGPATEAADSASADEDPELAQQSGLITSAATPGSQEDEDEAEEDDDQPEPLSYADLVGRQGGMTPLHYAARDGRMDAVEALLASGSDVDRVTEGDHSSPLLVAAINGNYDVAMRLLEAGADPNLTSDAGAGPLFAALNNRWAPKALYPQPTAFKQQRTDYLELMEALLDAGADPDARLSKHLWYTSFNFDLLGVDFMGATPFWRAAYALDIPAMQLLVAHGADHTLPTQKPAERRRRRAADDDEEEDPSGLPPVPYAGPAVPAVLAASGVGYGQGFAANSHRHVPDGWVPAVRYLVEELGHDPRARDHNGYNAIHHAAARGDDELIEYLVSLGVDPTQVSRRGQTTVDMANGPVQRVQPFPETIALLESLGAVNNHKCQSC